MKNIKIDDIDLQILQALQQNGRLTNLELSKQIGLSAPPTLRRVNILQDAGYIESYQANISATKLGYNVTVFVFITLKSQNEEILTQLENDINEIPMVKECYMISGEFDFVLKVVATDWEHYNKMLKQSLMSNENILNIRSALAVKKTKSNFDVNMEYIT